MITITKYLEQLNKNGKAANHIFEFTYDDPKGKIRSERIEFTDREFEKKKATPNTSLADFFKQQVMDKFEVAQKSAVEKETLYLTPDEIKTKLGSDTIET